MQNENNTSSSGAASIFATHAKEITVWYYCPDCEKQVPFRFVCDEGIYEVYQCPHCPHEQKWAVR